MAFSAMRVGEARLSFALGPSHWVQQGYRHKKMAGLSPGHDLVLNSRRALRCYAFFFGNIALMLSNSSILAPCLRMMMLCCATDSELFQAQ